MKTKAINNKEIAIKYFTNDARIIEDPCLHCFIGIKGLQFDGNDFFDQAYKAGVRVFILQKLPTIIPDDAVIYFVSDTLDALAQLAHEHKNMFQIPHVLITGSVGKTTTRLMLTYILREKYETHTAKKNWNNAIGTPLTILETDTESKISI